MQNVVPLQVLKNTTMHKKSSSGPRNGKRAGSSPEKKESRYGNSRKEPFDKKERNTDNRSDDRPRKSPRSGEERNGDSKDRKPYSNDRPKGPYRKDAGDDRKPYSSDRPKGPYRKEVGDDRKPYSSDRPKAPYRKEVGDDRKPYSSDRPKAPYRKEVGDDRKPYSSDRPKGPYRKDAGDDRKRPSENRRSDDERAAPDERRPYADKRDNKSAPRGDFKKPYDRERKSEGSTRKPTTGKRFDDNKDKKETPADFYTKRTRSYSDAEKRYLEEDDGAEWEVVEEKKRKKTPAVAAKFPMPLNKFIAHSGECSRRDAAELVRQGKAKVNGELIIDPGHKIEENDKVTLSGKKLIPQKGMVYILLNKPKGFITTNDDPKGRRTVMDLVASAGVGRMFPVGRLDRATTGLLLITNDGDVAQKLAHPSNKVKKVYHVTLDKPLTKTDFDKIMIGLELEDGKAIVDEMAFLEKKNELGLEIHSGRNRIVRRIFESLGYVVEKLDRVMYAGLTKKNLPRSKWRFLDEREVILLKHFKS